MKEEALDRTMWRNRFGRGFGPVVFQITVDDDDDDDLYGSGQGVGCGAHPHLECRGPRKGTAIPLLTPRAFVAYKRVKTYLSVRKCLYRNGAGRAI